MAVIPCDAVIGKAQLGQRDGGLPGRSSTIGITPDTVKLTSQFAIRVISTS